MSTKILVSVIACLIACGSISCSENTSDEKSKNSDSVNTFLMMKNFLWINHAFKVHIIEKQFRVKMYG